MSDDAPLKQQIRSDLTVSMKDRDKLRSSTLRMVLSAITEAEVSGAQASVLSNDQVLDVVIREAKKRREAETAFRDAGRDELADQEHAEAGILADYLPKALSPEEITQIVHNAISATGSAGLGMRGMKDVMFVVQPQTKGKADGGQVAAEVRRQLGG